MLEGGNAVDAAVATLFCIGVVNPQSSGIGGGSMMTIYNSSSASASFLNAREMAPLAATEDMFHGDGALAFQGDADNFPLHNIKEFLEFKFYNYGIYKN